MPKDEDILKLEKDLKFLKDNPEYPRAINRAIDALENFLYYVEDNKKTLQDIINQDYTYSLLDTIADLSVYPEILEQIYNRLNGKSKDKEILETLAENEDFPRKLLSELILKISPSAIRSLFGSRSVLSFIDSNTIIKLAHLDDPEINEGLIDLLDDYIDVKESIQEELAEAIIYLLDNKPSIATPVIPFLPSNYKFAKRILKYEEKSIVDWVENQDKFPPKVLKKLIKHESFRIRELIVEYCNVDELKLMIQDKSNKVIEAIVYHKDFNVDLAKLILQNNPSEDIISTILLSKNINPLKLKDSFSNYDKEYPLYLCSLLPQYYKNVEKNKTRIGKIFKLLLTKSVSREVERLFFSKLHLLLRGNITDFLLIDVIHAYQKFKNPAGFDELLNRIKKTKLSILQYEDVVDLCDYFVKKDLHDQSSEKFYHFLLINKTLPDSIIKKIVLLVDTTKILRPLAERFETLSKNIQDLLFKDRDFLLYELPIISKKASVVLKALNYLKVTYPSDLDYSLTMFIEAGRLKFTEEIFEFIFKNTDNVEIFKELKSSRKIPKKFEHRLKQKLDLIFIPIEKENRRSGKKFISNDLYLIYRLALKQGTLSVKDIKSLSYAKTKDVQDFIKYMKGKNFTAKDIFKFDNLSIESDLSKIMPFIKRKAKIEKGAWSGDQRIFKEKNHVMQLNILKKDFEEFSSIAGLLESDERQFERQRKNSNHPVSKKDYTLGWVRYTIFENSIWIDEIQTDLFSFIEDTKFLTNIKKLPDFLLHKFIQLAHKVYGKKILYIPEIQLKRRLYAADPPTSIYRDVPKKARFKTIPISKVIDIPMPHSRYREGDEVWILEASVANMIATFILEENC
jgi:hypothetical protein